MASEEIKPQVDPLRTQELEELKGVLQKVIDNIEEFVTMYESRCQQYQRLPASLNTRRSFRYLAARAVLSRSTSIVGLHDLFERLAATQNVDRQALTEFQYWTPPEIG